MNKFPNGRKGGFAPSKSNSSMFQVEKVFFLYFENSFNKSLEKICSKKSRKVERKTFKQYEWLMNKKKDNK